MPLKLLTKTQYNRFVTRLMDDPAFLEKARKDMFAALKEEGLDVKAQLPKPFVDKIQKLRSKGGRGASNPCAICGICAACTVCGELNAASGLIGLDAVLGVLTAQPSPR